MVEHALRLVVKRTRVGPIYPAIHQASVGNTTDPDIPAMGQRLRLAAGYAIPANFTTQEKAVLLALKKYGAIVADNGGFFSVSVTPDDRYGSTLDHVLNSVPISGFEVVQSTGAAEGPRAPGAPIVNADADQWVPAGSIAHLQGSVTGAGSLTAGWKLCSGPAPVTFGDATQAVTTATFAIPGNYTLMLSAADSTHAVAYDAVIFQVTLNPTVSRSGMDEIIGFATAAGHHYRVEHSDNLADWLILADNIPGTGAAVRITHAGAYGALRHFYRVVVLD